jgi:hypothetical protein
VSHSKNCPKCDADISDSYQPEEWDVGIRAGWYCDACDLGIADDGSHEPLEGDAGIPPAPPPPDGKLGTPISELSGRPGHKGYTEWLRISKSWGYD